MRLPVFHHSHLLTPLVVFGPSEDLPLDYEVVRKAFDSLTDRINTESGMTFTPHEVACGFINVGKFDPLIVARGEADFSQQTLLWLALSER